MRCKQKGLAIDKETLFIFLLALIIFVIVTAIYIRNYMGSTESIYTEKNLREECGNWQLEDCKSALENFKALNEKFKGNITEAKKFCNCPR